MKTRTSALEYTVNLTECGTVKLTVFTFGSCRVEIDGFRVTAGGVEVTEGWLIDWVTEEISENGIYAFGLAAWIEGSAPADDRDPSDFIEQRDA